MTARYLRARNLLTTIQVNAAAPGKLSDGAASNVIQLAR